MARGPRRTDLTNWLYHLDSYTNAEFGQPRTLVAILDTCVACGGETRDPDVSGLCKQCAAKRRPDHTEIILFRPMKRRPAGSKE